MIKFQHIEISTDGVVRISVQINVNHGVVKGEAAVHDEQQGHLDGWYRSTGQHHTPEEAFVKIIDMTLEFIADSAPLITKINNPTNTEFLSRESQKNILDSKSIAASVVLNEPSFERSSG